MKRYITTITVIILSILQVVTPVFAQVGLSEQKPYYNDIAGHRAESLIEKMTDMGLLKGIGGGKFSPDTLMTRAQFAVLLHRVLDIRIYYFAAPDITKNFDDVKNDYWFSGELIDLVTTGIVDGNGSFRPSEYVTREEMVMYFLRSYFYKTGYKPDKKIYDLSMFSDELEIDPLVRDDVGRAYEMGLIKGINGKFSPKTFSTRAEALFIFDKFIDLISKNDEQISVEPSIEQNDGLIEMKISIKNNTDKDITIRFDSGQKYDFILTDVNDKIIYNRSEGKFFIQLIITQNIKAGEVLEFIERLDENMTKELKSQIAFFKAFIIGTSDDFVISQKGYEVPFKR